MIATPRLAFALCLVAGVASAADRFAVVVGANEGGGRRAKLWFAEQDAQRFARTLIELGDFEANRVTTLLQPSADGVRETLAATEAQLSRARAEGRRTVLVFYFSGHAGTGALELGGERLDFAELKALVEGSAADVKVAIVDACESGTLTQVKGARPTSAIDFVVPTEDSARGVAYLASTAVGEVAQESAAIGGSFFTFHLDAALRGAGDANADGQVSLAEAFQYTSSKTITGTSTTDVGPQHPTYNFRMSGRGDVILSDLRKAEATLVLGGDASSDYLVKRDGQLVAESTGGRALALPAGRYQVERRRGGETHEGQVELDRGARQEVSNWTPVVATVGRSKGGVERTTSIYTGASVALPTVSGLRVMPGARVGLRQAFGRWAARLALGYENSTGTLPAGVEYRLQTLSLDVAGLRRLVDARVFVDTGLELGVAWHTQGLATGVSVDAAGFGASGVLVLGVPFGRLVPQLQASGGARLVQLDQVLRARPLVSVALLVAVEF
ncbi:MAG: caspase family protein [Myxococcota bacterium]